MPAWYEAFDEMVGRFPVDEVLRRLVAADVPAVPVLAPDQVADNEQVQARDAVRVVDHPLVGPMRSPRPGARFEGDGDGEPRPAPAYAQHTDELLAELGYDGDAIAALHDDGTVV
jgi:crotonobetainyl-CoA:carnitine CoA-transferase CaiB-like acyl-CoA transferase